MFRNLLCAAALLVGSVVAAHAAPVISITPSTSNVAVGDHFTLDIQITGVSDLYGWQLDVNFGPTGLLAASPATEGAFLGAGQTFGGGTVDNAAGTISTIFSALSGPSGVSGDGILASIGFDALAVGTATLSVLNVLLSDSNLDDIFFSFPADAFPATVNIAGGGNVPEPSTLALLILALASLSLGRRMRGIPSANR